MTAQMFANHVSHIPGCPARTSNLAIEVCELKSKDAFNDKRITEILAQIRSIESGRGEGAGRDIPIDDMMDAMENGELNLLSTPNVTQLNSKQL